jgi:hypothetical protein
MRQEELTDEAIDYICAGMCVDELSAWERSFFESVADQRERRRSLSDRQKEILGQIWDKQP